MGLGGTGTPPSIMVAPLHQVCTGISGKVQTKMPAEMVRIVPLEVDTERYVLIRVLICTIYTRNGEPSCRGNPGPGACEIRTGANIAVIHEYLRQIGKMSALKSFSWCKVGCK